MVILMDLHLRKLSCFQLAIVIIYTRELLILLSSDVSPYCDTFDMMHRYSWSLYYPISNTDIVNVCLKIRQFVMA